MLGIGVSAARTEADGKKQLGLRQATSLILAADINVALPHPPLILQKLSNHSIHAGVITITSYYRRRVPSGPSTAVESDLRKPLTPMAKP